MKRLCDASRDGTIRIVTSVLTVSECLHIGDADPVDQPTRDLIVDFLTSGRVVDLAEADIFIAEKARSLWWDHNIRLKGADGIHVATALEMGCTEFITTDARVRDQTNKFSNAIVALRGIGLNVIRGSQTAALPVEYRTDDLFPE
jgi:predicted nucleic acid-binding protein